MKVYIETKRLILRPLTPEDAEAAFRWCSDPDVNTYLYYPLYHRVEDVRAWLERRNPDDPDVYDEGIVLKETGELIGSGGLSFHPERNAWEIGYNLRADQWGHGYTVEMLNALMAHIRKIRPLEAIDGIFASENYKSQRVMEKLGMIHVAETKFSKLDGSRTFPALYYRRNFLQPSKRCSICAQIHRIRRKDNPYFVWELETGYVVLGDHQRFEGYTVFICKEHATKMNQLSAYARMAFLKDMTITAEVVQRAFHPDDLDCELISAEKSRHMHWHLFPKHNGDTPRSGPAWLAEDLNDDRYIPTPQKLEELKQALITQFKQIR